MSAQSNEIVFDIETVGNIRDLSSMKITVVSTYEYTKDKYTSFDEHQLGQLWPLLENADRLIGYNSLHFDIPILNRYYPGDLNSIPHLDMLKVIKESSGSRFRLNDIAKATLNLEKSADGLQAMEWYKEGKIDLIKEYCEQDVKVTKDLYDYGRTHSIIYYPTLTGEIKPIAVEFGYQQQDEEVKPSINYTLPF